MITESFLNSCFSIILNKKIRIKRTPALYRDIIEVLDFTTKRETYEIPVDIKNKVDFLRKVTSMLITGKAIESIVDSVSFSEKFKQHQSYLDFKINEELTEADFQDYVKQVRIRKKISALFANYDELDKVLESIKDGSFDSIDDLLEDYEITIKKLYSNMMEAQRGVMIEAAGSLDLVEDSYDHVINMIVKKYERQNKTPTGFELLDKLLIGGYEPSRLYIWGGGTGAGKSTILNNTIYRSAMIDPTTVFMEGQKPPESNGINRVYIYITMENTIEESFMRTYQPMFGLTADQMLREISSGVDIRKNFQDRLARTGSTIVMKYFPAMSISTLDLMGVVDEVISKYGKDAIAGLYVDYLDLLKTDMRYDMYRLELGHITLSLKSLAVQYNIPVITASQLSRKVYQISDSCELNLDQMSESIKKVEHADFVGLIAKDKFDDTIVHGKIGKNRAGQSNVNIDFKVDFSKYLFINATRRANKDKQDASTACGISSFTGLGVDY